MLSPSHFMYSLSNLYLHHHHHHHHHHSREKNDYKQMNETFSVFKEANTIKPICVFCKQKYKADFCIATTVIVPAIRQENVSRMKHSDTFVSLSPMMH
ncbi:unnamed protein product [Ceratitis capitata]|uniref:(Mediterranean fruit fly) hypothetical protein n=1 Tax=Ceratitis capitata TaxID=7213 RepID=A0A811VF02_CERCA|nr:unnamed protein product [Ceratitis capitata]